MMNTKVLFLMGVFSLGNSAWAQNCPAGIPPGVPGCIPPDNPASPLYRSGQSAQPAAPRIIWADRWGAIATDGPSASLGTAIGMRSKRQAEKIALAQCRVKGGGDCKVDLTYYNQCAVLITGDIKYLTQGAATIEEASRVGIQRCRKADKNCRVYYADCSMAERIQ